MPLLPNLTKSKFNILKALLVALSLILPQTSCGSNKLKETNENFLKKYGEKVEKINERRNAAVKKLEPEELIKKSNAKRFEPIDVLLRRRKNIRNLTPKEIYQAKIQKTPPSNKSQLEQTIANLRVNPKLEIMPVLYVEENFPSQYDRAIISFDDIKIPIHDYHGIRSSLDDKEYDRIDPEIFQKNIDALNNYFRTDNREINLILLKEKEEVRRKKMAELLLASDEEIKELEAEK